MTTLSADWVEPPEWFDPSAALEAKNPIPLLKRAIAEEREILNRGIEGKVGEQQRRDVEEAMKPQEERLPDALPPNVTDAKK